MACQVGVSVKRDQQPVRARQVANQESEEPSVVISPVRDLPHITRGVEGGPDAPEDGRRLKDDALLLCPEQSEQQEVDDHGGQRGEREHVTRMP